MTDLNRLENVSHVCSQINSACNLVDGNNQSLPGAEIICMKVLLTKDIFIGWICLKVNNELETLKVVIMINNLEDYKAKIVVFVTSHGFTTIRVNFLIWLKTSEAKYSRILMKPKPESWKKMCRNHHAEEFHGTDKRIRNMNL